MRIILNPAAGSGAGRRKRAEIERELTRRGAAFEIVETSSRGEAASLAEQAVLDGVSLIVAAGGDGTIHEVSNGLLRARGRSPLEPTLGAIPIGTGNDFVKLLPMGTGGPSPYDLLVGDTSHAFDVGLAAWDDASEYFVNGLGTGIDVEVVRQIERFPQLPGTLRYLAGLVAALVSFRPLQITMRIDEQVVERSVMIVAVGNGRCIGGGFYVCPNALPDDGALDLCVVKEVSYLRIVRVLPRIMRGTHTGMDVVEMNRLREIEFRTAGPLIFQLDGELREAKSRMLNVRVKAGVLKVKGAVPSAKTPLESVRA